MLTVSSSVVYCIVLLFFSFYFVKMSVLKRLERSMIIIPRQNVISRCRPAQIQDTRYRRRCWLRAQVCLCFVSVSSLNK